VGTILCIAGWSPYLSECLADVSGPLTSSPVRLVARDDSVGIALCILNSLYLHILIKRSYPAPEVLVQMLHSELGLLRA